MEDIKTPRPLMPGESIEKAVYCADCEILKQDVIGSKIGTCKGHQVSDTNMPIVCPFHKKDSRLISVMVFLKSGISVYHKAIVKDLSNQMDPSLLSSFLQAVSIFGEELAKEEISLIQFQRMNIVYCRGKYSNGAMIIKGTVHDKAKDMFLYFLRDLEEAYPNYFDGSQIGLCLPEEDVDKIAVNAMQNYAKDKFYTIPSEVFKKSCNLKCGKYKK